MGKQWSVELPWAPMPKARPKFNSDTKTAYMPNEYMEWKKQIADLLILSPEIRALQGPVALSIVFEPERIIVHAKEMPELTRFGSADIDNLIGGVMDALENGGAFANDRQVAAVYGEMRKHG